MERETMRDVIAADFAVPAGRTVQDLAPELEAHLGATDPEIRDELAYVILGTWVERGLFPPADLARLAEQMTANLRAGIGEQGTDSVLRRSFSALILTEIVALDARARVLPEPLVRQVLEAGLTYVAAEQDVRGYVPQKGWAHSVAHTADLLKLLAAHPLLGAEDLWRILKAIGEKVAVRTTYAYVACEEERLALAVLAVLERRAFPVERLTAWLEGIPTGHWVAQADEAGALVSAHNTKALLTSLYTLLSTRQENMPDAAALLGAARQGLHTLMPHWY
jgi:hypothetical protein